MDEARRIEVFTFLAKLQSGQIEDEVRADMPRIPFPAEPTPPGAPPVAEIEAAMRNLMAALIVETDRGCALVGAAYLDEALAAILSSRMRPDSSTGRTLLSHKGALGSAFARGSTAYAFGLIEKEDMNAVNAIAEVRNKIAHERAHGGFEEPDVVKLLKKVRGLVDTKAIADFLRKQRPVGDEEAAAIHASASTARGLFIVATTNLYGRLMGRHVRIAEVAEKLRELVAHQPPRQSKIRPRFGAGRPSRLRYRGAAR